MLLALRELGIATFAACAATVGGLPPIRALWVGIFAWAFSVCVRWDVRRPLD